MKSRMALLRERELAHSIVSWSISVASHCPQKMRNLALTEAGTMKVVVQEWTESLFVRKGYEKHASVREDLLSD